MRTWIIVSVVTFIFGLSSYREAAPAEPTDAAFARWSLDASGSVAGDWLQLGPALAGDAPINRPTVPPARRLAPLASGKPRLRQTLRSLYRRFPRPPHSNYTLRRADVYSSLPENAVILNIGSKDIPVDAPRSCRLLNVDIDPSVKPDIVADAHDMHMISSNTADCVLAISMLHHCRKPWRVVEELHRILKPGGVVYANIPFVFPFHTDPDDYWRVSFHGVDVLFESFEKIESGYNRGPASCMAELLPHFGGLLFSFGSKTLYGINVDVLRWGVSWIKYLDIVLAKHPSAHVMHTGTYFLGRKALKG